MRVDKRACGLLLLILCGCVADFFRWCETRRVRSLQQITPTVIAGYIERRGTELAKPSVKQHLAAIRMLFDWLVVGQIVPVNPASSVRGPKHVVKKGKTPILTREETRALLDSIEVESMSVQAARVRCRQTAPSCR